MNIILKGFDESTYHCALGAIKGYKKHKWLTPERTGVRHVVGMQFEGLKGAISIYHTKTAIIVTLQQEY
jgi:hypothetical protein